MRASESPAAAAASEVDDIAFVVAACVLELLRGHVARDEDLVFLAQGGDISVIHQGRADGLVKRAALIVRRRYHETV